MNRATPLPHGRIGWQVIHLSSVPSTNEHAKRLARLGQPHGIVVIADQQTRGRGQRGRRWASPAGGLWASVLVRPSSILIEQVALLNVAAAAAVAEAIAVVSGTRIALKWPNDLLLGGHKVGGVLVETATRGRCVTWAVVGVGVNVNNPLETLPVSVRMSATSLRHELGRQVGVKSLLREICTRLDAMLDSLEARDHHRVIERWRGLDATPGRRVRAQQARRVLGVAASVDLDGRLVVRTSQGRLMKLTTSSGIAIE